MSKQRKWTEKQLREAIVSSTSIRQVLNKIGLISAGGNYTQIKSYIGQYKIDIKHFKGKAWNKGLIGIGRPRITIKEILVKNSNFELKAILGC